MKSEYTPWDTELEACLYHEHVIKMVDATPEEMPRTVYALLLMFGKKMEVKY
jgi:hypothetical protein